MTLHEVPPPPDNNHADPGAEQALLGTLLVYGELTPDLVTHLEPGDFYQPRHETLWTAIGDIAATGLVPDHTLVLDRLRTTNQLKPGTLDGPYLHDLVTTAGPPASATTYARIIRDHARLRTAQTAALRFRQAVDRPGATPTDLDQALDVAYQSLDDVTARTGPRGTTHRHVQTIDDLLAGHEDDDTYDWVIPDLLEHQDRVILTAAEGAGKSTLIRQLAICAASGIHPFTGHPITPQTVLHVDVENSRRQSRRRYRPLRLAAGDHLDDPTRLRVEIRVEGLDLTQPTDVDWLTTTCDTVQPDLLLIGPIYKLANGDPTEEKSAKPVAMALDLIRARTDAALVLEAHAPKAPSGQKRRPREPYGWSGWMRWPEFGLWLDETGRLEHWRGDREERAWPDALERGGQWPWSVAITDAGAKWLRIREARDRFGALPMSIRQVAAATGLSKSEVARLIGAEGIYGHAWRQVNGARPTATDEED